MPLPKIPPSVQVSTMPCPGIVDSLIAHDLASESRGQLQPCEGLASVQIDKAFATRAKGASKVRLTKNDTLLILRLYYVDSRYFSSGLMAGTLWEIMVRNGWLQAARERKQLQSPAAKFSDHDIRALRNYLTKRRERLIKMCRKTIGTEQNSEMREHLARYGLDDLWQYTYSQYSPRHGQDEPRDIRSLYLRIEDAVLEAQIMRSWGNTTILRPFPSSIAVQLAKNGVAVPSSGVPEHLRSEYDHDEQSMRASRTKSRVDDGDVGAPKPDDSRSKRRRLQPKLTQSISEVSETIESSDDEQSGPGHQGGVENMALTAVSDSGRAASGGKSDVAETGVVTTSSRQATAVIEARRIEPGVDNYSEDSMSRLLGWRHVNSNPRLEPNHEAGGPGALPSSDLTFDIPRFQDRTNLRSRSSLTHDDPGTNGRDCIIC